MTALDTRPADLNDAQGVCTSLACSCLPRLPKVVRAFNGAGEPIEPWTRTCRHCVGQPLDAQVLCTGPCSRPDFNAAGGRSGGKYQRGFPEWQNSGDLIHDLGVSGLPYLDWDRSTFDATLGPKAVFWKRWRPQTLVTNDIDPTADADYQWDWTTPPPSELVGEFGTSILDAPFKLAGSNRIMLRQYGLDDDATNGQRLGRMETGLENVAATVRPGGYLLYKCQSQVAGGHVRWQPFRASALVDELLGWGEPVDEILMEYLAVNQDHRGPQQHARRNYSTLLVFQRPV